MNTQLLTRFGMTNTEVKVYMVILKLKNPKIGQIIKNTGLHRGTVYNSITSLINKGFVSYTLKDLIKYYSVSGQKIFESLAQDKKEELEKNTTEIKKTFEELEKLQENLQNHESKVLYGVDGFKTVFLEMYEVCKRQKLEYLFLGMGGKMMETVGEAYYKYTQNLKKKLKIKCRILLSKETKKLSYRKYTIGNIKYIPTKINSPVNFWIYGDTTFLVLWDSKPLITILIKSKDVSNGFRNYFEYLWGIGNR